MTFRAFLARLGLGRTWEETERHKIALQSTIRYIFIGEPFPAWVIVEAEKHTGKKRAYTLTLSDRPERKFLDMRIARQWIDEDLPSGQRRVLR